MTLATLKKILRAINYKTVYFNFKHFPFKDAIKFPVLLSNRVVISKNIGKVIITGPLKTGIVKIGFGDVGIFDKKLSRTILKLSGTIFFKGSANIGHGSKVVVGKDAELILGRNFILTAESALVVTKKVEIGDDSLLSWDILIMDSDLHQIKDKNGVVINKAAEVKIGNKVWIGCRTVILKGASIPDNSIIAANSLIARSLEGEYNIFGGNPVGVLKSDVTWEP
ncbi:acyltransferase [Chitinophaga arvensicola]|uniref:Acetyltransferase (Isoleucine patch superfamily) n=1 Tax=Chitinophaga arvensicola TaxID=29529 RepID=A0A1I0NNL9_9BACT|nr:hypothetical protein [Chitinophaga arvensicola]SEW02971.1 Acetyltransferase (isoleucine patch superfamily) [Chitinophaga arvensicola]